MKVTELSGEHLGMHVVLEHKKWKISGVLHDVYHETEWTDNRSYGEPDAAPIPGERTSRLDIAGWTKRIGSREAEGVTVTL